MDFEAVGRDDHLSLTLEHKHDRSSGGGDRQRLVILIEHQNMSTYMVRSHFGQPSLIHVDAGMTERGERSESGAKNRAGDYEKPPTPAFSCDTYPSKLLNNAPKSTIFEVW